MRNLILGAVGALAPTAVCIAAHAPWWGYIAMALLCPLYYYFGLRAAKD